MLVNVQRIEDECVTPRFDACRRNDPIPALAWLIVRAFEAPSPQARCNVTNFH